MPDRRARPHRGRRRRAVAHGEPDGLRSRQGEGWPAPLEGEIAGDFDADIIELSGKVKDNTVIRARSLNIKLSPDKGKMQVVFGECSLEVARIRPRRARAPAAPRRLRRRAERRRECSRSTGPPLRRPAAHGGLSSANAHLWARTRRSAPESPRCGRRRALLGRILADLERALAEDDLHLALVRESLMLSERARMTVLSFTLPESSMMSASKSPAISPSEWSWPTFALP